MITFLIQIWKLYSCRTSYGLLKKTMGSIDWNEAWFFRAFEKSMLLSFVQSNSNRTHFRLNVFMNFSKTLAIVPSEVAQQYK